MRKQGFLFQAICLQTFLSCCDSRDILVTWQPWEITGTRSGCQDALSLSSPLGKADSTPAQPSTKRYPLKPGCRELVWMPGPHYTLYQSQWFLQALMTNKQSRSARHCPEASRDLNPRSNGVRGQARRAVRPPRFVSRPCHRILSLLFSPFSSTSHSPAHNNQDPRISHSTNPSFASPLIATLFCQCPFPFSFISSKRTHPGSYSLGTLGTSHS